MKACVYLCAVSLGVLSLTGCVSNPINAHTGSRYYDYGLQAAEVNDWALARQNFYRAYVNAQIGNFGTAAEAYSLYEWSRMSGYLGMYSDAEKGLNDVLTFIGKAQGKADTLQAPTLSELDETTVVKDDPIGFADFVDDYTGSLRAAGFDSRADEVSHRAAAMRVGNKGLTAKVIAKRYKPEPSTSANGASPRR